MRMRRIALNQRGSAVVEFVLVAPLVILVFAAVAQICLASYVRSTLIACAAEWARAGAEQDADRFVAVNRTKNALSDSIAGGTVEHIDVGRSRGQGAETVAVTITARLPLFGLLGPTTLTVTGHALSESLDGDGGANF